MVKIKNCNSKYVGNDVFVGVMVMNNDSHDNCGVDGGDGNDDSDVGGKGVTVNDVDVLMVK